MYIPKRYGESKITKCAFCEKQSTAQNQQGVLVCSAHKNFQLDDIKCFCGSWLELRAGKWGPYYNCIRCGNVNFKKAMEMKSGMKIVAHQEQKKEEAKEPIKEKTFEKQSSITKPREITITSDDIDLDWS